jgi:hypothetical protein
MLTGGRVSQADFLDELGEWSDPGSLADRLNTVDAPGWHGGFFPDEDTAVAAASRGPMAVTLQAPGIRGQHMVVTEPLGDGMFRVRDPWNDGSTYVVGEDWIRQFVAGGVFR